MLLATGQKIFDLLPLQITQFITATAASILLFTEGTQPSGIFLKKMPPRTILRWQHVNRNRSSRHAPYNRLKTSLQSVYVDPAQGVFDGRGDPSSRDHYARVAKCRVVE